MKHDALKRLTAAEAETTRLMQNPKGLDPADIEDPELRALMERFNRLPSPPMRGPIASASRNGIQAITPEHTQLAMEILSYLGRDDEPTQDFRVYLDA